MKFHILVNECGDYRVEKLVEGEDEWKLCFMPGGGDKLPWEFQNYQAARDYIQGEIEAPEWERKRNTWKVVEEVEEKEETK